MSYINNYGQSVGPVKIENIWAGSTTKDKIYLAFAKDVTTLKSGVENYAPLLAETPTSSAPDNAVATIEWVKLYTTAGNQPLDLSKFATKTELGNVRDDLLTLQYKIEKVEEESNYYTEELEKLQNSNTNIIKTLETNRQNILKNTADISEIKTDINDINAFISSLNQKVADNTNNILKNAENIATNAVNIQKNTSEIEIIKDIVDEANQNASESINKVNQIYNDVEILKTDVLNNTSNIANNAADISVVKETLENYGELIENPFPNGIIIKCGGAAL